MLVVLAAATYRTYDYEWVRGLVSLGWPENDAIEARFRALGVKFAPAPVRGYGGGRSTGIAFGLALEAGADLVVTVECDMAWNAEHLADLLEARGVLAEIHGPDVAVGATYPASSKRGQYVLALEDGSQVAEVVGRIPEAVERYKGRPRVLNRYARAAMLPCGFTAWPVEAFRGVEIVERLGPHTFEAFDLQASELLLRRGGALFYDLALDVGHGVAIAETAVELARRGVGRA